MKQTPIEQLFRWVVDDVHPAGGLDRIQRETGVGDATPTPASPTNAGGSESMTNTIGGTSEDFSLEGTGITHVPGVGRPEFDGLLIGADGSAVARIRDGALVIEIGDLDTALAWRNAWHNVVSHLIVHREQQKAAAERPARADEVCTCGQPAVVVYRTAKYGDVPYCGVSGGVDHHDQEGTETS